MKKSFLYVSSLVAISAASFATFNGAAHGAPPTSSGGSYVGDRVTICHRTNAINNPYVKITVDPDAIMHEGHGPNNSLHNIGTGVFDPDFDYPNNAKNWNDIIPPFDYTYNGVAETFPGYNYSGRGLLIYENDCDGYARATTTTTSGGGTTTTSGGGTTTTSGGGTTTTSGGGTTEPGSEETTTTTVPLPRNGVRVTIYVDLDNDCQKDENEPTVPLVSVTVAKGERTYTLITDASGTVVEGPLPGGNYTGAVDETPSGLDVTCTDEDSTRVPGNGIGDIKIGLRGDEEIEITVEPPTGGDPEPDKIIINYCGDDAICDNEDDFEFEVEIDETGTVNGRGLPAGKYYIKPASTSGVSYEAVEFTLSATSRALTITPEAVADPVLANSGTGDPAGKLFAIVLMMLAGTSVMFARRRTKA